MADRELTFENPCFAEALTCDFEDMTWTFEPYENFVVTGGNYVIMPLEVWQAEISKLGEAVK